jgi:murein L,D-transpeptidase YcbB/YkuD
LKLKVIFECNKALTMRARHFSLSRSAAFGAATLAVLTAGATSTFSQTTTIGNWNQGGVKGSNYASTTTRVVKDFGVSPMITTNSYRSLQNAIARYQIIVARGGWPKIPRTRVLVRGSKNNVIPLVKRRLAAEGFLPASYNRLTSKKLDDATSKALIKFQKAYGLQAYGRMDQATARAMSVPAAERLSTLRANLPRVQDAVKGLGDRYIIVNIPATQLDAVEFGIVYSRHNVIVGQASRPSPILKSQITELNFNPYWNAPVSIVRKDILPKLRKSLGILKQLDIKIFDGYGGPEVDPKTVDWSKVEPKRYHFRQQPGKGNAMASVKINFSNKYAVYMHDTPTKQLFTSGQRYFSSGCVRIDKIHLLTSWLLKNQQDWNRDKITSVVKSGDRLDVKVRKRTQVRFVYLTAWVTDDGIAHFRNDIYKLDGTGFVSGQPRPLENT